ncbi:protein RETARDED ROOT GROWTH, mitochondrial-like [Ziziphus jujuba]|uniref:Protein RETARDED ROOT GROWTH, mitochondrial-like n=1 Tax=Ziziphus jujuba TaxID=326968 RepID=A0ABM3IRP7_ZIZJJ|nr:protein RETARDED ROOT GROWTH, mitochondrial-like [Ziziphus jujuba]
MGRWRRASFLLHHITAAAKSLALNPSFSSKPVHLSNRSRPTYHFLSLRRFSALPSRVLVDTDEFDSEDPHSCQNYGFGVQEDEDTGKIPVKAYFLCTSYFGILVKLVRGEEKRGANAKGSAAEGRALAKISRVRKPSIWAVPASCANRTAAILITFLVRI